MTLAVPVLPSPVPAGRIVGVSATMTPVHDYGVGLLRLGGSWRVRAFVPGDIGWSSAASGWAYLTAR